jgi:hypothetical protein
MTLQRCRLFPVDGICFATYIRTTETLIYQNLFLEPPTSFAIIQNKVAVGIGGNITVVDGQVIFNSNLLN